MNQEASVQAGPGEQWKSESIAKLVTALAKAQAAFGDIKKTKRAGKIEEKFSYLYADLSDTIAATKKPLADNELAVTQITIIKGRDMILKTILFHSSGEWISSEMTIPEMRNPKDFGSILTYARRYSYSSIVFVAADEDIDGTTADEGKASQKPQGSKPPQGKAQAQGGGGKPQGKPAEKPPAQKKQTFKEFLTSFGWTEEQAQEWVTLTYGLQKGDKSTGEMIEALKEIVQSQSPENAIFMARNP